MLLPIDRDRVSLLNPIVLSYKLIEMSKHIVFLLHGVGKQTEGWSTVPAEKIKANCNKVLSETENSSDFELTFVELNYGHLLDANMFAMVEGSEGVPLVHDYLSLGLAERNNSNYVAESKKEKIAAALRDYALDLPTYLLNWEFTKMILISLAEKVTNTIAEHPSNTKYSLICHSLGTKVGFDLLHLIYTGSYYNVHDSGNPTEGSPTFSSFYQLASIPWIMTHFDSVNYTPNNSYVRVRKVTDMGVQNGVIRDAYRIYGNKYDPIAWIGQSEKISPTVYSSRDQLDYIDRIWMHDFNLYLDHPKVYLSLVEDLLSIRLEDNYKEDMIAAYDNNEANISQEMGQVFGELKHLISANPTAINSWDFVKNIKTITDKLEELEL